MFFRRKPPVPASFADRLRSLGNVGFTVAPLVGGAARVSRGNCAVDLTEDAGAAGALGRAGMTMGGEIGVLVDGGFQKFFRAPSGARRPATAADLAELHDFEEDLREGLGEDSYYNESLGTVSTFYQYDRLKGRGEGVVKRPWE